MDKNILHNSIMIFCVTFAGLCNCTKDSLEPIHAYNFEKSTMCTCATSIGLYGWAHLSD